MKISEVQSIDDALRFKMVVQLETPVAGYWDGGPKSRFEFTPKLEHSPGPPAIRWGSWTANLWFVVEFKNGKQHFRTLRRKLCGRPARTITFIEAAIP